MEVDTRLMIVGSLSVPIWQRHQRSVTPVMVSKSTLVKVRMAMT